MVPNSNGEPPDARTPTLISSTSGLMPALQGVTSLWVTRRLRTGRRYRRRTCPWRASWSGEERGSRPRWFPKIATCRVRARSACYRPRLVDCVAICSALSVKYSRIDVSILRRSTTGESVLPPTYIQPAARAVIFDDRGRILLIRRGDNKQWALPAGGMEPGSRLRSVWRGRFGRRRGWWLSRRWRSRFTRSLGLLRLLDLTRSYSRWRIGWMSGAGSCRQPRMRRMMLGGFRWKMYGGWRI